MACMSHIVLNALWGQAIDKDADGAPKAKLQRVIPKLVPQQPAAACGRQPAIRRHHWEWTGILPSLTVPNRTFEGSEVLAAKQPMPHAM